VVAKYVAPNGALKAMPWVTAKMSRRTYLTRIDCLLTPSLSEPNSLFVGVICATKPLVEALVVVAPTGSRLYRGLAIRQPFVVWQIPCAGHYPTARQRPGVRAVLCRFCY